MARIAARNTMRAGQQAVLKYIAILFFLLHWAACAVRMIGFLTLDGCHAKDNLGDDPAMTCGETILAKYWNRGIWAQYVNALVWALGTLQGGTDATTVAEEVLCLVVGLLGCIVMAFLVGDLCNVVGNMDPVGNDYSLTMDTLNNWFDESQLPVHLRKQLREYMGLAEKSFRDAHNKATLERLSPTLKAVVMHHNLEREVANIPFYAAARGAPRGGERCGQPRTATMIELDSNLEMLVKYDDGETEEEVPVSRVNVHGYRLGPAFERQMDAFIYQHDRFVLALSTHVSTKFFMTGDVMVHANQSLNTEMFIISTGRALVWGDKSANPVSCGRRRRRSASVLDGPPFVETVGNGQFSAFYRGMRKYGAWQLLRYAILRSVRLKQRLGTPFEASLPALGAGACEPDAVKEAAADAVQVLLKKVLATDAGKLEGLAEVAGATLCRSLEAVKQILADPAAAALAEQEAVEKVTASTAPVGSLSMFLERPTYPSGRFYAPNRPSQDQDALANRSCFSLGAEAPGPSRSPGVNTDGTPVDPPRGPGS
ncbi:voltage-gated potassium channel [Aureococcus anophagefferens]|nr:voltage-gated potassium channel [Aureococcus anophagefferens]